MLTDPDDEPPAPSSAGAGDGLAALYHQHRRDLLRFLTARCGDATLAEDLMQDLWIRLNAHASGPVSQGRPYLFRMANNLVLDSARARHRRMARDRGWIESDGPCPPLPEARPDPAPPADEDLARAQETLMLSAAIATLPPGARQALQLYRLDEHSQSEVAKIMGISRSGVEKHLAVAMKHLRQRLMDCGLIRAAASGETGQAGGGKAQGEQPS